MKRTILLCITLVMVATMAARGLTIKTRDNATEREKYAVEYLQKKLAGKAFDDYTITLTIRTKNDNLTPDTQGYNITRLNSRHITIEGYDPSGVIYGAVEVAERLLSRRISQYDISEWPQMSMRGTCIGLQKTTYLPGHTVYEYPYTPENFPWFYDKELWIRYLDMMVENKFNSLYLWNGHPFASLVRLKDYPFAVEVDDETFRKNEEMFSFLTREADRRGIWIIQMFYNIILSKPFADHYGLKTQDRNRPITPLIADYTRKSIAAFIEKYPNVGLLVCLGEAMATIEDDVKWMKETIIPGIKDGLAASGRKDIPPVVLRSHDTDGPLVLKESLPLYPNIYTMSKYTGESLTTYNPGGPWGETHRQLADAAPVHIDNVHILANLEPWRWSSPSFIWNAIHAMRVTHHAKGLHLYPQASYWDWPYTADKLPNGERLLQIDRDWMWYKAWGRYAWSEHHHWEDDEDDDYWLYTLSDYYGISEEAATCLLNAYNETGEIAPMLLRRFGITEGNRQTLLLGMTMAQLVNPYKFNIYPGFYESCGPQGEKLIEYVEKEIKDEKHVGELPLNVVNYCVRLSANAIENMKRAMKEKPTRHADEWQRVWQDFWCYNKFAISFRWKVMAAEQVLRYKWTKDIQYLDAAVPLLEKSLKQWRLLCNKTDSIYLYANSMQTSQRRIPVGGDNGNFKTWSEMLPVYEAELEALKANIEKLKHPKAQADVLILPAKPAEVSLTQVTTTSLKKDAILFENRADTPVDSLAPELAGMKALVLNRDTTRIIGTSVTFDTDKPVKMLVGFFQDDDPKWAKAPKLEVDATGNEYGQAEPILTNAISIIQMPPVHIHAYHFPAGHHTINLPKGIIMIAGFTADDIKSRDVGLQGAGDEVDWLFK